MAKPVESCLHLLVVARQEVNKLLTGTEHTNNLLEINSLFQRLETKFRFMGAVTEPEQNGKSKDEMFPPITNFMGVPIEISKKITRADLDPKEADKQKFRGDVKKLYDEIRDMQPDQVLNAYAMPEHKLVIRGVAKIAGVEDYESKEINIPFIEEIQMAIELKAEQGELIKGIDKVSKPVTSSITLTEEAIAGDPNLQKMNAKPGDEAISGADGKVTLKRNKK